jgi:hypothetical protein
MISRRQLLLVWFLGLAAFGCGSGLSEVSGTVKYQGKPLTTGSIQFLGSDGVAYPAKIGSDGTYTVRVRPGEAQVLVSCIDEARMFEDTRKWSESGRGGTPEEKPKPPPTPTNGSYSLIPEKYANWYTSGLKVTIKKGQDTQDFDLQ